MIKRYYHLFLGEAGEPRSWLGIIGWWELRRIPYNMIVGTLGFVSLLLFFLFIDLAGELKPGEDAIEPLALIAAPVLINIAYTLGWIAELFLYFVWRQRSNALGPAFYKLWFVVFTGRCNAAFCSLVYNLGCAKHRMKKKESI